MKGFGVNSINVPVTICYVIDKRIEGIRRTVISKAAFHGALDIDLLIRSTYLQGLMDGQQVAERLAKLREGK